MKTPIKFDEYIVKFRSMIKSLGLNNSTQREYVLKVLFENKGHLKAEDIQLKVKEQNKINIGIATVYRILSFLEEMKIVKTIAISGNDSKVYELNLISHHDHIICEKCNKIVEFYNPELEKMQEEVAKRNGFVLEDHDMLLYGICEKCQ